MRRPLSEPSKATPSPISPSKSAPILNIPSNVRSPPPYPVLSLNPSFPLPGLTQWLPSWLKRGFKTASGDPVKNHDIIVHLWVLLQRAGMRKVRFTYVKGHAGHYGNEEADVSAWSGVLSLWTAYSGSIVRLWAL